MDQETNLNKDKLKDAEEEWENTLLNWKSKRRQKLSFYSDNDSSANDWPDDNGNISGRKIKTFAEMMEERAKSGNRLGFNLQRYMKLDDDEENHLSGNLDNDDEQHSDPARSDNDQNTPELKSHPALKNDHSQPSVSDYSSRSLEQTNSESSILTNTLDMSPISSKLDNNCHGDRVSNGDSAQPQPKVKDSNTSLRTEASNTSLRIEASNTSSTLQSTPRQDTRPPIPPKPIRIPGPMARSLTQPLPDNQTNNDRSVLSVSGKKLCSSCKEELGRGAAAFVVQSLNLVYHTNCFRCSVCHANLANGFKGVDVRVHAGYLHCQNCYSKDGLNYSRV